MAKGRGRQQVPPVVQIATMRARFPDLRLVDRRQLVWRGPIVPIEGGRAFTLEVHSRWRGKGYPGVRVLAPTLVNRPGSPVAPHTYADGRLCLYHPDDYWWTSDQLLVDTILPWACEWCFYYEIWLETGRWIGAEYDHPGPKREPHPETTSATAPIGPVAVVPRAA